MMYRLTWGSKRALSARLLYWSAGTCVAVQGEETNQPPRATPTSFLHASMAFPAHGTIMWEGFRHLLGCPRRRPEGLGALRVVITECSPQLRKGRVPLGRWGNSRPRRTSLGGWGGLRTCSPRLRTSLPTQESLTVKAQALESVGWVPTSALPFPCQVAHFSEPQLAHL